MIGLGEIYGGSTQFVRDRFVRLVLQLIQSLSDWTSDRLKLGVAIGVVSNILAAHGMEV
jgi:hypothetical protein